MFYKFFWSVCLLLIAGDAFASGIECGDIKCEDNEICLDRGAGKACWQTCRVDENCDSGCCRQITSPYTSWICVDRSECGLVDSDGDFENDNDLEQDSDLEDDTHVNNSDGDSWVDIEQGGYGGQCGEEECNSWQICIVTRNGSEACATVCKQHSECASGCCAKTSMGKKICLSANESCPVDVDGDKDSDSEIAEEDKKGCDDRGLFCESVDGSFTLGMLMLAWLLRFWARRKFRLKDE